MFKQSRSRMKQKDVEKEPTISENEEKDDIAQSTQLVGDESVHKSSGNGEPYLARNMSGSLLESMADTGRISGNSEKIQRSGSGTTKDERTRVSSYESKAIWKSNKNVVAPVEEVNNDSALNAEGSNAVQTQKKKTDDKQPKNTRADSVQFGKERSDSIHYAKKRSDSKQLGKERSDSIQFGKEGSDSMQYEKVRTDIIQPRNKRSDSIKQGRKRKDSIGSEKNRSVSIQEGKARVDSVQYGTVRHSSVQSEKERLVNVVLGKERRDSLQSENERIVNFYPGKERQDSIYSGKETQDSIYSGKERRGTIFSGKETQDINYSEKERRGSIFSGKESHGSVDPGKESHGSIFSGKSGHGSAWSKLTPDDTGVIGLHINETESHEFETDKSEKWKEKWAAAVKKILKKSETSKTVLRKPNLKETDPFLLRFNAAALQEEDDKNKLTLSNVFSLEFWRTMVINPALPFYYKWSAFISMAVYYNIIVIIMRAVFFEMQSPRFAPYWYVCDYFCDFLYLMDVFIKTRLGFLEQGILVGDTKRLKMNYVYSRIFAFDVISFLPIELFQLLGPKNSLFRMNRIIKAVRINEFYEDSDTRTSSPNMFRLLFLIINIMVVIHWNACIFFAFSSHVFGINSDQWVYSISKPMDLTFEQKYLASFYWSMLTLTAIGDNPPPERIEEYLYSICCTLIGVLIFATIFGNIGAMINQMNASRSEFQQNVDSVKRYMVIRKVCPFLQARVIQWFSYTWNNKQSVDDRQALAILPEKLRAEIAIHVHLDTLKRVAIFQDCEPGLLVELVLKLRLQVISPGDYICRKGDIGKEMYIVKRGKLVVVSEDGKDIYATLEDGAVFGEISILHINGNKTGNRRTASVRSVGYSDLFCLSKDDLWSALAEYPDAKHMLTEKGRELLRKDDLLDEDATIEEELRGISLETKLANISEQIEHISSKMVLMAEKMTAIQEKMCIPATVEKPKELGINYPVAAKDIVRSFVTLKQK